MAEWKLICGDSVLEFGSHESGFGLDSPPRVGDTAIYHEDTRTPRGDGLIMGQDFLGGATVELDFTIYGDSYDDARSKRERLAGAWRGDLVRGTPGAMAELVSHTGRTAFGRPRRFKANDFHMRRNSIATAEADFVMADGNWYGDEHESFTPFAQGSTSDFTFPATFPWTTTGTRESTSLVTVSGSSATPLVIEVRGPIVNPVVEIGPLRFEFVESIAHDQVAVIDARPNKKSITVNGRPAGGALSGRSNRLSEAVLPPGEYPALLRGSSESGTASLVVRWRDAFAAW